MSHSTDELELPMKPGAKSESSTVIKIAV